jgi:hypothetical protein
MPIPIPEVASGFAERLRAHDLDALDAFADAEIMTGRPLIFAADADNARFQETVATELGIADAAADVLIIGSARMGFSLDPDRAFQPFKDASDIDVVVVHAKLFDEAWRTMLAWDYLTIRNRTYPEQQWLYRRHDEVWSGWYNPSRWNFRERDGIELSFPDALKPVRDFSFRWFSTFRSLSRYRHHAEIPRHRVTARLYRTRQHVAMYHTIGLRALRTKLDAE